MMVVMWCWKQRQQQQLYTRLSRVFSLIDGLASSSRGVWAPWLSRARGGCESLGCGMAALCLFRVDELWKGETQGNVW